MITLGYLGQSLLINYWERRGFLYGPYELVPCSKARKRTGGSPLEREFYLGAMDRMMKMNKNKSNIGFVVATDDPKWAKKKVRWRHFEKLPLMYRVVQKYTPHFWMKKASVSACMQFWRWNSKAKSVSFWAHWTLVPFGNCITAREMPCLCVRTWWAKSFRPRNPTLYQSNLLVPFYSDRFLLLLHFPHERLLPWDLSHLRGQLWLFRPLFVQRVNLWLRNVRLLDSVLGGRKGT